MYTVLSEETPYVFLTGERVGKTECIWSGETIAAENPAVCIESLSKRGVTNVWLSITSVEPFCRALEQASREEPLERKNDQSVLEYRSPVHDAVRCSVCGQSVKHKAALILKQMYVEMGSSEGNVCCHYDCLTDLSRTLGRVYNHTDCVLGDAI